MKHIYFLCIELNNIINNAVHSVELLKSNYKQKLSVWKHKPLNRTAFFNIFEKVTVCIQYLWKDASLFCCPKVSLHYVKDSV